MSSMHNHHPMTGIGTAAKVLVAVIAAVLLVAYLPFPVHMVFTWVDGSDAAWQAQYADAKQQQGVAMHLAARDPVQFASRTRDDIYYAVHTALKFMPWLECVWIVTQRPQQPWWLQEYSSSRRTPPVRVVHHDAFFHPSIPLPTFNSNVIESQLPRIPGLAEHFIMSNDDMYTCQPLVGTDWFLRNGTPRVAVSKYVPSAAPFKHRTAWEVHLDNMATHCATLGVEPVVPAHVAAPVLKSALAAVTARLDSAVQGMTAQPLRNPASFPLWYIAVALAPKVDPPPHVTQDYYETARRLQATIWGRGPEAAPALVCIDQFDADASAALEAVLCRQL